ncbi:hypothetical protein [Streptomyces sp. NPDC008141]|uniref:hypothetical protein n=1 Tax=Streptomyces sp. NPDC008141 TaxID=3364815 RepID=UPI0036E5ADC4
MVVNPDAVCRLCWLQRARLRRTTGDRTVSYAQALHSGWIQLSFAGGGPQERRPDPRRPHERRRGRTDAAPVRPRQAAVVAPVVHRQLTLFPSPPRDIAAALHAAAAAPASDSARHPALSAWLGKRLTDWAAVHGWSRATLGRARSGLRMLLAVQDTPGAPIKATWIEQLAQFRLPTRLLHEFLTAHSFIEDDRTPAIESFFARITDGLPEPMTGQLATWMSLRLKPSRSRPRTTDTVRHQLRHAMTVLAPLAAAGVHDLADITPLQLRACLGAARLTGTELCHTVSAVRIVFTVLHAHGVLDRNPAMKLRGGSPAYTIPLPAADLAPIRQSLASPEPARAAITALLVFHALRAGEIRRLTLEDALAAQTGPLRLPGRTVLLAEPVRVRLAAYLAHRRHRWPATANPHLFITQRSALSTTPVSRSWLFRQYPASAHVLRSDRIVDEVRAADGDALLICELFGLGIKAATRYTAAGRQ